MADTLFDFDTAQTITDFWVFDQTQPNTFNNGNGAVWKQTTGSTPSRNTGPSAGQNNDGYVYIETSSPHNNGDEYTMTTVTPINFAANAVDMTYWYNMYTDQPCQILVEGWDGTQWVAVDDYTPLSADLGDAWYQRSVTFSNFTNTDGLIRFRIVTANNGTSYQKDVALDTITLSINSKESDVLAIELVTVQGATRVKLGKRNKYTFPGKSAVQIQAIITSILAGIANYDFAKEYKHGIVIQESQNIIHVITKGDKGI